VEQRYETSQHGVVPAKLERVGCGRPAISAKAVKRTARAVLVVLAFAAGMTACGTVKPPALPPGSGPTIVDETVTAEQLPAINIPVAGGGPAIVRIGPRPSGEPGMCVDSLFLSRGKVKCLVLSSSGKMFSPIETARSALRVNLLVHPDVAHVRVTINSKTTELTLVDVPGVPGARIFAYEARQRAAPPLRFLDATGQEIDDSLMLEYRHWG
jgi:hypothetical protein